MPFRPRHAPVRLAAASLLCVTALGLSGCQSITADGPQAAQVRFVDTSVDAPGLDLYLNDSGAAYGLSFGTVTSYIPVTPGELKISVNRANTAQALIAAHANLGMTKQYTAVVSNVLGSLQETVYRDANAPAPAGMLAVRVLNEAAGAGPLDVYLLPNPAAAATATPLVRALPYAGEAAYVDLPAGGGYNVAVVPAGASVGPNTTIGITVTGASGSVRTLVISDSPVGAGKGLSGFVLDDFDTP